MRDAHLHNKQNKLSTFFLKPIDEPFLMIMYQQARGPEMPVLVVAHIISGRLVISRWLVTWLQVIKLVGC